MRPMAEVDLIRAIENSGSPDCVEDSGGTRPTGTTGEGQAQSRSTRRAESSALGIGCAGGGQTGAIFVVKASRAGHLARMSVENRARPDLRESRTISPCVAIPARLRPGNGSAGPRRGYDNCA